MAGEQIGDLSTSPSAVPPREQISCNHYPNNHHAGRSAICLNLVLALVTLFILVPLDSAWFTWLGKLWVMMAGVCIGTWARGWVLD